MGEMPFISLTPQYMAKSKKYQANLAKIREVVPEGDKTTVEQAVELLMTLDLPKFKEGSTVELHFNLNINPTKSDQLVRSNVVLPHGTGKKIKVAAFVTAEKIDEAKKAGAALVGGEDLIEEIKKSEKVDFDIAVAEPEMMKKLPVIARILGVAGVMPNPKTGTVGQDIKGIIEPLLKGKINFKNDKTSNIHLICGKVNKEFSKDQLVENINTAIEAVAKSKPDAIKKKFINSAYLTTSMSPSIRVI